MAVNVSVNGVSYSIPQTSESGWGDNVTSWIQAISSGTLQRSGGSFTLTADVDFGSGFGLKLSYIKSQTSSSATSGVARLANGDAIAWRDSGGTADLGLKPGSADGVLEYSGVDLVGTSLTQALSNKTLSACTIDASSSTISNIVDANVSASAAIALTKLASVTASRLLVSDGSGNISASSVSTTTLSYLDVSSSIQTQLNGKQASGNYITALTGDVTASGPGSAAATISNLARSKIAAGTLNQVVINDGSGNLSSEANLAISRGGTGAGTKSAAFDSLSPMSALGDLVYGGTSGTGTRLSPNTTSTQKFLAQTGTGTIGAAPGWVSLSATDIPSLDASKITTGQIGVANGGTGAATLAANGVLIGNGTSAITTVAPSTSGNVLTSNGTAWVSQAPLASTGPQTVVIRDEKANGTDGGTATTGSFVTRTLNTLENPLSYSWVTLSSNQVTLSSGTYVIQASSPFRNTNASKTKWRNITDSTDTIQGSSEYSIGTDNTTVRSLLSGTFTLASSKTFALQYRVGSSSGAADLGPGAGFSVNEVYSIVTITKVA